MDTALSMSKPSSQQANILTVLLSELLVHIFSYLSSTRPTEIAACRLPPREPHLQRA